MSIYRYTSASDIGSVLIGNNDWTFAVPNIGGDGTTRITIYTSIKEFDAEKKAKNLRFISSVQGKFNIYNYDCAFNCKLDEAILTTLNGRYGVYNGDLEVAFVLWEDYNEKKTKYTNLGDINYLAYGGNLVWKQFTEKERPDHYKHCFYVFSLYTPWDLGDNKYAATLHTVDVRDHEKHKYDILSLSGNEDKCDCAWLDLFEGNLEVLASEIVSAGYSDNYTTYKGEYSREDGDVVTLEEVKSWLTGLGIDISEL